MQVLPTTEDEARRLAALAEYEILDTQVEALFDAFTRLLATMCETPISLMTLVTDRRQWFKSNHGLPGMMEIPRAGSFCERTIQERGFTEVPDATQDPVFAQSPFVIGEPHLRFYAGAPLITRDGYAIGTICVLDRVPRTLTEPQRAAVVEVAAAIVDQLETRRALLLERDRANQRVHVLSGALGVTAEAVSIGTLTDGDPEKPATIVYANEAFLKLNRGPAEQIVGHDASRFSGPLTDRAIVADMRRKMMRGEACRADYISYKLDGSHYYASFAAHPLLDDDGKTTHMVTIQRDISDIVLRDRRLALENERLTTLTAIARSIFAALDPRALVETLVNGAHKLLDADAQLLVAVPGGGFVPTDDLLPPEGAQPAADPFIAAVAASKVPMLSDDGLRGAVRILGSVGEPRYVIDLRSPVPLQTADIFAMGLLGQYVAVAARNVELYGELQARRTAVVELNEVKNDLIAMLAHDFKGPLTTIVGFADVLAEDDRFDDESRKFLAMISSSAMRLASLATDTLALSRLEQNELTLNIESFDLVALVRDIVRVFSVTRAIDLVSDRAELTIAGDPARLRQVFENLIGNAIKYSPNGEPVKVKLKAKGRGVEISVHDEGIGIPDADRPKLFGRFARAQNARAMGIGGTGFGLYLTKTIVEMHGGTIGVDSKEGHGSTFRVFVPAAAAVNRPVHRRFILLDAAGDARSYVAHTLRDDGFAVTVAGDGEALLAQVDETEFDAALIDVDRVGMPLDEFVRRVAGRTALIRIDGSAVDEVPGWDGYLTKPFLTKDLRAALDVAIARHPRRKPDAVLSYAKGSAG
jgi:signal transduction histidine kinase/CheY-like chemotaxis protein/PAS domain-containing protein